MINQGIRACRWFLLSKSPAAIDRGGLLDLVDLLRGISTAEGSSPGESGVAGLAESSEKVSRDEKTGGEKGWT